MRTPPRPFDPARAKGTFDSLGDALSGIPVNWRDILASAFGNCPYLCRLALRERKALREIVEDGPASLVGRAIKAAGEAHEARNAADVMGRLRRAKRQAALAIALADIGSLWDLDAETGALTRLADASLGGALRFLLLEAARASEMPGRDPYVLEAETGLVVLAMGKAGAFELNYSSDLDLVVFYDTERFPFRKKGDPRGAAVDLVKGLVKLLGDITPDGYVFRIDLRLRPDAGATQVAISTEAAERYYEEMGQNWERAAFIKARPCAGDLAAAVEFLRRLEPFVWRRNLDYAAIEDIHSIKRQIEAHGRHGAIAAAGHNIKLGRGGIREIEFFTQTQQLILGGRNRGLRERRTLDALAALAARGFVSETARAELSESYVFLRRLEHRLQMVDDEQTHALPKSDEGLAHIACFAGYEDTRSFADALVERLRRVQHHYESLFTRAPPLGSAGGNLVFTGVEDDPDTIETLARLGFCDPRHIAGAIRGWHHGRIRATRSARARELLTRLVPALLNALASTADPGDAFAQFDRFVSRLPGGVQLFSLLLAQPQLLQRIATIMGSAPRLADHLARFPAMLDAVLDRDFLSEIPQRDMLARMLQRELGGAQDHETVLDAARRFGKEQSFRIGTLLIDGTLTPGAAAVGFTNIAECLIGELLRRAEDELAATAGRIDGGSFSVVAMGKLGGCEMTAASDVDLIFVYDAPDSSETSNGLRPLPAMTYYARLAQRLIAALTAQTAEGRLYEVDMRLRPSGNKGPAAVSLRTFDRYHRNDAWTWERLALTRARVIAGPPGLRAKIEETIRAVLTRKCEAAMLQRETREMRDKLAAQFPGRDRWDLKFARGGLVDIEFVVQFLQLRHGWCAPDVLHPNTTIALARLAAAGFLDKSDADVLRTAAALQLALIQILRISVSGRFDPDAATSGMKTLLARVDGADSFGELERRLAGLQRDARAVFERLLPS